MKYIYKPATTEKHFVTFWRYEYPKIFETGAEEDQYFLAQDVKSWLVKNDIKVFVTYDCGDMGGGEPIFNIEFLTESDARLFVDKWSRHGIGR